MDQKPEEKKAVFKKEEVLALREEVMGALKNSLVLPHTMLQRASGQRLTDEESEDAAKCLHATIAAVEQKFIVFLNR